MSGQVVYKLVVFGAGGVGKSSITLRFTTNTFSPEYLPTIEDSYRKHLEVDGETTFLDILDTAGQEEYAALRDSWVREGRGFLLVYSVDSKASFDELTQFRDRILDVKEMDSVPIVLLANKCDLRRREVGVEAGKELARHWDVPFIETSAVLGTGCTEAFEALVRVIHQEEKSKKQQQKPVDEGFFSWCTIL